MRGAALLLLALHAGAVPGYESFSNRDLWRALATCDAQREGCELKLSTRTATTSGSVAAASCLAQPALEPAPATDDGMTTELVIGGAALLGVLAFVAGWVAHGSGTPSVVVAR